MADLWDSNLYGVKKYFNPTYPYKASVTVPFKINNSISPVGTRGYTPVDIQANSSISPVGTRGYTPVDTSFWDKEDQMSNPVTIDVQTPNTKINDDYNPNTPFMRDGIPISVRDYYANNGIPMVLGNKNYEEKGFWDEYLEGIGNYIKQNPLAPINALGSLWNGWQSYKNNREALKMAQRDYDLKKQAYYDQEARNKEAFAMQKRNWQGHQL